MARIYCRRMVLLAGLAALCMSMYAQKTPQTFLWRISGNGLSKPSFLYGTIHLRDKRLFYFSDSLYHYFEQAEGFNIEVDADSVINASVRKWSQENEGRLLKTLMNRKEYDKWAGKLSKTLGKPADKITTRDIWEAKNRQTAEAYKKGDMQSFMDLYLYSIAKKQGKLVGGIEDVEDQLSIIDDLFDEIDLAYLTQDSARETGLNILETMKQIYLKQDLDAIESFTSGQANQKFKDIVLMRRNVKMALRMDSLARRRSSFFAVGVAHLPGDTGVIDLLRKRGFSVDPVFSSKKIAPENYTYKTVDQPWNLFTHELNLYHVETPGTLQPMDMMKEIMDMEFYYDMYTGKVYYTAVINSTASEEKKDSVFSSMINRMSGGVNRGLVSQKPITRQNWEGRDVVMKTGNDQLIHLNVYLANGYAYMAMVLAKKEEINDKDTKRFFDSFVMTPTATITRPYISYRDTAQAFSVLFPHQPAVQEQTGGEDGSGAMKVFSATDYSSGNSYALTVRNTKAGNYIPTDTSYLRLVKAQVLALMKGDTVSRILTHQGYPAVQVNGPAKAENVYYHTLTVLRGNRTYFLIAQSKGTNPANALADSFFHSFSLNNYGRGDWQIRTAPDGSFSSWLPALVQEEKEDEPDTSIAAVVDTTAATDEPKDEFVFHDKATATSYNIEREKFSAYYFTQQDSSFFSSVADRYKAEGDSITGFKLTLLSNDKAADVEIQHAYSSIIKKFRFILHGDTLYKVFTYTPRWLAQNGDTRQFFDRFHFPAPAPATTLFSNKTAKLVDDLGSADSATFHEASFYLYDAKLQKKDLPAFLPLLLKPLKDFSTDGYGANNRLVEAIAPVADSSTVDFVLQHYHTLNGEAQKLQYSLLKLLVMMEQPYASQAATRLFDSAGAPAGSPSIFANTLTKHLPLAKKLFPKIAALLKEPTAALDWSYLLSSLLDSNVITKDDLLPQLDHLIAAAATQKKGVEADDYDYSLTNVLDLFGALNTPTGNAKLQEYSRLNNLAISYQTINWLINNKQPLPVPVISKLAKADAYRTFIYDTLKSAGKASLFPAAQLNQKQFAASYMLSYASDDDDPASVVFVSEKTAMYKGKKQKFYLYKVSFGEDEDVTRYLGIAGPFPLNAKQVTSKNEATGLYWEEEYAPGKINSQFNAHLANSEREEDEQ
ncbi:MAG: TraB/GumN family protein [Williamsia sp.]|nr:TraB/GumN family protein [Williamsia sp.]